MAQTVAPSLELSTVNGSRQGARIAAPPQVRPAAAGKRLETRLQTRLTSRLDQRIGQDAQTSRDAAAIVSDAAGRLRTTPGR